MKIFLIAALFATAAQANFLSYIDDKGTRHIVSSADEIPEQYRDKAKQSRAGAGSKGNADSDSASSTGSKSTATDTSTEEGESRGRSRGYSSRRKNK